MTLVSLILVLLFEQWRPFAEHRPLYALLARYARFLQRHFNAGEAHHGVVAWCLGVIPPLLVAWIVYWLLASIHPVLGLLANVAVLYVTMNFRLASQRYLEIQRALNDGDLERAREILALWSGKAHTGVDRDSITRLTIEQAIVGSHRFVFGVVFWFVVLPGPLGPVLYRIASYLSARWGSVAEQEFGRFGWFAREAFYWIDWIPARLTAVAFAVVGNFEDAVYCWRTQAARWSDQLLGVVLASGAGAMGVRLGNPIRHEDGSIEDRPELGSGEEPDAAFLDTTVGLLWRALVLWLALILIVTMVRALS